jgi:hypothetical protein
MGTIDTTNIPMVTYNSTTAGSSYSGSTLSSMLKR